MVIVTHEQLNPDNTKTVNTTQDEKKAVCETVQVKSSNHH
jgi:hypothetical protein